MDPSRPRIAGDACVDPDDQADGHELCERSNKLGGWTEHDDVRAFEGIDDEHDRGDEARHDEDGAEGSSSCG